MTDRPGDDIVCYEVGSGDTPAWEGSRRAMEDDWAALVRQCDRGVIELDERGDHVAIRGASRVGLVVLPSGRRLVIRSKIPTLALLEWLAYLGEFQPLSAWLPDPGVATGEDLHACLARLFLNALEHITLRHVRKDYVTVTSQQANIRGRILATALARQMHRLPRVPQVQRVRSADTPYNRVLAMALDRVSIMLDDGHTRDRQRLSRMREEWGAIPRGDNDPVAAITAAQGASPPGYRDAVQLARMLLIGAAIDPTSGMGGEAFTLSLASVWEKALRRMFDELSCVTKWRRVSDERRTRRWDDPTGRDDPNRWLIADVIVERPGARWVLDAKYKREFGNESRADRFQMCAYAVAFDADRVSLVYPAAEHPDAARELLVATIGSKRLCIDSLALPMAAGPVACCAALAAHADRKVVPAMS